MTQDPADADLKEPDLLQLVLDQVRVHAPQVPAETLVQIECIVRAQHGGVRARIAKRRPHLTEPERQRLHADVLGSASDAELAERYRISRATLYRHLKRGGGGV